MRVFENFIILITLSSCRSEVNRDIVTNKRFATTNSIGPNKVNRREFGDPRSSFNNLLSPLKSFNTQKGENIKNTVARSERYQKPRLGSKLRRKGRRVRRRRVRKRKLPSNTRKYRLTRDAIIRNLNVLKNLRNILDQKQNNRSNFQEIDFQVLTNNIQSIIDDVEENNDNNILPLFQSRQKSSETISNRPDKQSTSLISTNNHLINKFEDYQQSASLLSALPFNQFYSPERKISDQIIHENLLKQASERKFQVKSNAIGGFRETDESQFASDYPNKYTLESLPERAKNIASAPNLYYNDYFDENDSFSSAQNSVQRSARESALRSSRNDINFNNENFLQQTEVFTNSQHKKINKLNREATNTENKKVEIPKTSFSCQGKIPGMYPDIESGCQAWHTCELSGRKHTFACVEGTLFNQRTLTCDWWYNVQCEQGQSFTNKIQNQEKSFFEVRKSFFPDQFETRKPLSKRHDEAKELIRGYIENKIQENSFVNENKKFNFENNFSGSKEIFTKKPTIRHKNQNFLQNENHIARKFQPNKRRNKRINVRERNIGKHSVSREDVKREFSNIKSNFKRNHFTNPNTNLLENNQVNIKSNFKRNHFTNPNTNLLENNQLNIKSNFKRNHFTNTNTNLLENNQINIKSNFKRNHFTNPNTNLLENNQINIKSKRNHFTSPNTNLFKNNQINNPFSKKQLRKHIVYNDLGKGFTDVNNVRTETAKSKHKNKSAPAFQFIYSLPHIPLQSPSVRF